MNQVDAGAQVEASGMAACESLSYHLPVAGAEVAQHGAAGPDDAPKQEPIKSEVGIKFATGDGAVPAEQVAMQPRAASEPGQPGLLDAEKTQPAEPTAPMQSQAAGEAAAAGPTPDVKKPNGKGYPRPPPCLCLTAAEADQ